MTEAGQYRDPLSAYRALRAGGKLLPDPQQQLTVEKLQSLHHALDHYQDSKGRTGWKERFGLGRRQVDPPQGLYLFGGVGSGKSMLMDLFFATAPLNAKRRVHFHAFMQEVQERLHARRREGAAEDPLRLLGDALAEEATLFCFDEFHVVNIADAMILGRLFETLFDRGVVVVATSNFAPDRLYEGGLQRENFLPFIALIKKRLDIMELGHGIDYRRGRLAGHEVYLTPLGPETDRKLDKLFADITQGAAAEADALEVKGRTIPVKQAARGVARFDFADLCEAPLGPGDYLALAKRYHTVFLNKVPRMSPEDRNAARRFIILVDALYEARAKLVIGAAVPAKDLYREGTAVEEFARTLSRLEEMRSQDYIRD